MPFLPFNPKILKQHTGLFTSQATPPHPYHIVGKEVALGAVVNYREWATMKPMQ